MWKIEELLQANMLRFDIVRISVSYIHCSDQGISVLTCTEKETESKGQSSSHCRGSRSCGPSFLCYFTMWDIRKRGEKKSAGISSEWNILGGIQIRTEYFPWLCHFANSESILSPCNPQAEMELVWSEIAWWKHALLCDFAWYCNQISQ